MTTQKTFTLFLFFFCAVLAGQSANFESRLLGNWNGAFIKDNSFQRIDLELTKRNGQYFALLIMEEWHPTFGEFEVPVQVDSSLQITFPTGYGAVKMRLDTNMLEMIGFVIDEVPQLSLHLKKVPRPPKPNYELSEVSIPAGSVELFGHLHQPQLGSKTAIILVGGRGCYPDNTKYNLYAKFLRKYGIHVLAYQKRGTGKSSGDCNTATIQDLANDLVAAKNYLANHPNGYQKIGVLGISAGGWTMMKAEEMTDFDFMISIVGPATSVLDQQLQSSKYGAEFYGLSPATTENLVRYVNLLFADDITTEEYKELQKLLGNAKTEGWADILEDTDIPVSLEAFDELWVRRHNYDPAKTLQAFDKPLLAIYGQRDWIVPPQENIVSLRNYFSSRPKLLHTLIAHNAEHGMEMEAKYVQLNFQTSYWHFYRTSPEVRIEILHFLDQMGVTDRQ